MPALLSQITAFLPIFLASPTMYAGMLLIMKAPRYSRRRAAVAWVGSFLILIVIGWLALTAGSAATDPHEPSNLSAAINLILAAVLIALGIKRAVVKPQSKEKKTKSSDQHEPAADEPRLFKYFGVGILLTVTNPTSLASYFAAAKMTVDSGLADWQQATAMLITDFYFTLPVLVPLLLALAAPATAQSFLLGLDALLKKYGRFIAAAFLLLIGLYLAKKGIDILR